MPTHDPLNSLQSTIVDPIIIATLEENKDKFVEKNKLLDNSFSVARLYMADFLNKLL
tara:strand:+ start:317 stop:487 length:171 start_codon:yes stop_codon:yes gene_type:complete